MSSDERMRIITDCMENLGPHDAALREFELIDYTFEMLMDYGAFREFKRHRMQSYIFQPLTIKSGYYVPNLVKEASLTSIFSEAIEQSEETYRKLHQTLPAIAPYVVTHAHKRRILTKINLRECYQLFKLRTQQQAHFSIREVVDKALLLATEVHPHLFKHLPLRDFPSWWPFTPTTKS